MSEMTHDTIEALRATNQRLRQELADLRSPHGTTVELPEVCEPRTAQVTTGNGPRGKFVRASVEIRAAGGVAHAVTTEDLTSGRGADFRPLCQDDALADLEERLLKAVADVRLLRLEVGGPEVAG